MNNELIIGVWTYRSFHNVESYASTIAELVLAQAEMSFQVSTLGTIEGRLSFRSNPPNPTDPVLVLKGSIEDGAPALVRFQGVGVAGTAAESWVYDYIGYVVPTWPSGVNQAPTIVGSVIRTLPHPGSGSTVRPAGATYSFVMVKHIFVEPRVPFPLPSAVLTMLASRHHRLHHFVWHGTRNGWTRFSANQKAEIAARGWEPRRPAQDGGVPFVNNSSGEDFLFMHRQMINIVQEIAKNSGAAPIPSWSTIPAPSALVQNPNFGTNPPSLPPVGNPTGDAVPPPWFNPDDQYTTHRLMVLKSDEFYWSRMKWWDRQFKDPQYLSQLTLGELGALIEWSVHNDMHMRWASIPRDPDTNEVILNGREALDIGTKWDNPKYDFLGEQYSSHVNPVFWRLHGWVDARIDDWFAAHEMLHPGEVVQGVVDGTPWFSVGKWVDAPHPWVGPTGGHGGHHPSPDPIKVMEEVVAIMYDSGWGPGPAVFDASVAADSITKPRVNPSWF